MFLALLTAETYAQKSTNMGYCIDNINESTPTVIFDNKYSVSFQAAIQFPSARMMPYKGAIVRKIRVYTRPGIEKLAVWLRNSLDGTAIPGTFVRPGGITTEGWVEVSLKTPYVITGEDLVVGYSGSAPAGKGIVCDNVPNSTNDYSCLVKLPNMDWANYSSDYGAHALQAVIDLNGETANDDVALASCTFDTDFYKIGNDAKMSLTISNYSPQTVKMPKVKYSLNGKEVEIPTEEGTIEVSNSQKLTVNIPTADCTEGDNALKVWIESDNSYKDNDTISSKLACYTTSFPRKVLIEHFSTLACGNCPKGHAVLTKLLTDRDDYVWVTHHIGYGTDELTVKESNAVGALFGLSGAPFASFDRRFLEASDPQYSPLISIGYPSASEGAAMIKPSYLRCAETAAFISVNIDQKYDAATRTLTLTVSGEKNNLVEKYYDQNSLTVLLTEDKVQTKGEQSGSGEKVHFHVFRQTLTEMMGDAIEWNGNTYSRTFTTTIPEEWTAKNLKAVAYINGSTTDIVKAQILNANAVTVVDSTDTGIDSAEAAEAQVLSREYFNLNGQRVAQPTTGVYLLKTTTTQGVQVKKVIL